jgi:hypothetical protein
VAQEELKPFWKQFKKDETKFENFIAGQLRRSVNGRCERFARARLVTINRKLRWGFYACWIVSLASIAITLRLWGAAAVRAETDEIVFLTLAGVAWLLAASSLFPWFGLSLRDDVVERGNVAALAGLCGALVAIGLIYAGGGLGEGPAYSNNFFSAGLGTVALFVLWFLLEWGAKVSRSIVEDRDLASGIRLAAFLFAVGLVFGRAEAGDWHSAEATFRDFTRDGWPALVLGAVALVIEWRARPSRRRPFPNRVSHGALPACLYLTLAGGWVWHLGAWEGMGR